MSNQTVRNRYVSDGAGVVPPPRLLIMLFDRLVADVEQAYSALDAGELMAVNDKLCHAQSILLELHAALDIEAWPEGAQLGQVYLWLTTSLMKANVQKDSDLMKSCLHMLKELQSAWLGAYEQVTSGGAETSSASTQA